MTTQATTATLSNETVVSVGQTVESPDGSMSETIASINVLPIEGNKHGIRALSLDTTYKVIVFSNGMEMTRCDFSRMVVSGQAIVK